MEVEIPWKPMMVDTFRRLNWHLPKRTYVSDGPSWFKCTLTVDRRPNVFEWYECEFTSDWRPTLRLAEQSACKILLQRMDLRGVIKVDDFRHLYVQQLKNELDEMHTSYNRAKDRVLRLESGMATGLTDHSDDVASDSES